MSDGIHLCVSPGLLVLACCRRSPRRNRSRCCTASTPSPASPDRRAGPDAGRQLLRDAGRRRHLPAAAPAARSPSRRARRLSRGRAGPRAGRCDSTARRDYDGGTERGTVFRFDPVTLARVHAPRLRRGQRRVRGPQGGLVVARRLALRRRRSARAAGGLMFRIDPATGTVTTVHRFRDAPGPPRGMPERPAGSGSGRQALWHDLRLASPPEHRGDLSLRSRTSASSASSTQFMRRRRASRPTRAARADARRDVLRDDAARRWRSECAGTIFRFDPATGASAVLYDAEPWQRHRRARNPGPLVDRRRRAPLRHASAARDGNQTGARRRSSGCVGWRGASVPTTRSDSSTGRRSARRAMGSDGAAATAGSTATRRPVAPATCGTVFRFDLLAAGPAGTIRSPCCTTSGPTTECYPVGARRGERRLSLRHDRRRDEAARWRSTG